jgi:hypothetical protein
MLTLRQERNFNAKNLDCWDCSDLTCRSFDMTLDRCRKLYTFDLVRCLILCV